MASLRPLQPLRSASRLLVRSATQQQTRLINSATAPSLYAAHASVTGGRNGKIQGQDGLNVTLAMPKDLGGSGKGTNPEELFAAGYGACFQSAMGAVAPSLKIKLPEDTVVDTTVHLVGSLKELDMTVRVDMKVKTSGDKKEIGRLVEKTKEICPYSRATQGNVQTNVEVVSV